MVFVAKDALMGAGIWTLLMGLGVFMMYLPEIKYREAILTLVYPMALYALIQSNHTFVKPKPIIAASILAFLYSIVLRLNKNVRESQKDPLAKKVVSATSYGSIVLVFGLALMGTGYFTSMYKYNKA